MTPCGTAVLPLLVTFGRHMPCPLRSHNAQAAAADLFEAMIMAADLHPGFCAYIRSKYKQSGAGGDAAPTYEARS